MSAAIMLAGRLSAPAETFNVHKTIEVLSIHGDRLWELDIAEHHLRRIAGAVPGERYSRAGVEGARSLSEVIVRIAGGNFLLVKPVGVPVPHDWYPPAAPSTRTTRFST